MYLTECYVENFGVLHQYQYQPELGLNCVYAGNGTGKSTFAAFIRAMFYGMSATRTRKNLDEAERKKYKPWQDGIWGGYICFQVQDKSYKLERTFSDHDKKDTFRLIDRKTGLDSKDYSEQIGIELFGVDKAAFGTTMFVTQARLQVNVGDSISQKLGGKTSYEQDTDHFKKAVEILDTEYKQYLRTGRRGLIPEVEQKISELESKKWELKKALQDVQKNMQDTSSTGQQLLKEQGIQLTRQQQEKLTWLDDYFSAGIPDEEEIAGRLDEIRTEKVKQQVFLEKQSRKKILVLLSVLLLVAAAIVWFVTATVTGAILPVTGGGVAGMVVSISMLLVAGLCLVLAKKQPMRELEQKRLMELEKQEHKLVEMQKYCTEYMALAEKEQEYERLRSQLKERQKLVDLQAMVKQEEELSEQLVQLGAEINECRTRLEEYQSKAEILSQTRSFLEQAHKDYAAGYIQDVAGKFSEYLEMFDESLAKKANVTIGFDVNITENGMMRELDYFSSGIKDITWFCERMAIADAVFQQESPFLILDDPFVNLDDTMLEKAFRMLDLISEKTQILYMTCRSNRMR